MPSSATRVLASGFELPFTVVVPREAGFLNRTVGEISIALGNGSKQPGHRIRRAVKVFKELAATGALSGAGIPPAGSGINLGEPRLEGDLEFRVSIAGSALDDAAAVVLAHLLLRQRACLDVRRLRFLIEGASGYVNVSHDRNHDSTYPGRYAKLPFPVEDEEPEGEAVTFEVEFAGEPAEDTIARLNTAYDRWQDAVLRGAYALALIPPEDAHVETYDDGVVVVGRTAERSFHKLTADDAAVDAVFNMLASLHERVEPIRLVRLT